MFYVSSPDRKRVIYCATDLGVYFEKDNRRSKSSVFSMEFVIWTEVERKKCAKPPHKIRC